MNKQVNENKPETHKGCNLKHEFTIQMDLAIQAKNLDLINSIAEENWFSLTEYWYWVTTSAIFYDYPGLLKYLQNALKVDFTKKIRGLTHGDLEGLCQYVFDAAESGRQEITEYVVQEFKNQKIFEAAFHGAARGMHLDLLVRLRSKNPGFETGNTMLNAVVEGCLEECASAIDLMTRAASISPFVLEKNKKGEDALDKANKIVQFLSRFRK